MRLSFTLTMMLPFNAVTTVTGHPTENPSSERCCLTAGFPPTFFTVKVLPFVHKDNGTVCPPFALFFYKKGLLISIT